MGRPTPRIKRIVHAKEALSGARELLPASHVLVSPPYGLEPQSLQPRTNDQKSFAACVWNGFAILAVVLRKKSSANMRIARTHSLDGRQDRSKNRQALVSSVMIYVRISPA